MQNRMFLVFLIIFIYSCSKKSDLSKIESTGTIEAIQVDISTAVGGEVSNIFIEEGDKVKAGDVLLKIDDADYRIQHKLAKAQLDGASAQLKLLLAGAREEDVEQAQENVKAAKAAYEKAESN